mmetsp:Transcript_10471/g.14841  ORF Transcript_10471/g.14841 Transcript_10471/m.14841 type:complete len:358 (+) Transcript_10471:160-1233(+)
MMNMRRFSCLVAVGLLVTTDAFAPSLSTSFVKSKYAKNTKSFFKIEKSIMMTDDEKEEESTTRSMENQQMQPNRNTRLQRVLDRLDTLKAAGYDHDTSMQVSAKGGIILFCLAFCYKWYRARFINKIPVWDRQPQWNTVITNREQEKELKAFTCKNCGSTIFIARHRNWFFEGPTGIGGLGCYSCGAKGKDNFIMDRDRIVEDLGDEDDYFDYERPLDFVSAAERRSLLKEAGGDEEKANQALVDKAEAEEAAARAAETGDEPAAIETIAEEVVDETPAETETEETTADEVVAAESEPEQVEAPESEPEVVVEEPPAPAPVEAKKTSPPPAPVPTPAPAPKVTQASDNLDILDMDDF